MRKTSKLISSVIGLAFLACDPGGKSTAPDGDGAEGADGTAAAKDAERQAKAKEAAEKRAKLRELPPLPGVQKAHAVEFPKPIISRLDNGLEIIVLEDHEAPLVEASLYVKAGQIYSPAGVPVAGMVGSLVSEGTKTRKKAQIDEAIDNTGGSMSSNASEELVQIGASMMASDLGLALKLMSDEAQNPAFPDDSIKKIKEQTIQGIKFMKGQPNTVAMILARRVVYGEDSAYGRNLPTNDQIEAVTKEQLVEFHKKHYVPNNAILVIAGDVKPDGAQKLAKKHFGKWSKGDDVPIPKSKAKPPSEPGVHIIARRASAQATIMAVVPAPKIGESGWLETRVMRDLLSGGTMSTKLNFVLREQLGLTYGARASQEYGYDGGLFAAGGGTKNKTADQFAEALVGLMFEASDKAPEDVDLRRIKDFVSGRFALEAEGVDATAGKTIVQRQYGLPDDFWARYRSDVEAIKAEQLFEVGKKVFDRQNLQIIAVGKRKKLEEQLKGYGTVHVYDRDLNPVD
jgi:predicted Zn-dependent peptidase